MGTLFSGVGLISGLDISSIVDSLISVEARPRDNLVTRMSNIDAQRTAIADISARISAMLTRITALKSSSLFKSGSVSSSNSDVLSVTTTDSASPGSYEFIVKQLATRHQTVSRGFASRDSSIDAGTFTLESALARTNSSTTLDALNGTTGVQRGSFKLIDASGAEATVNISDAATIDDVINLINDAGVNIEASVTGDGITLTETTGGAIQVKEVDDRHVAADLGFGAGNRTSATGELVGTALVSLGNETLISSLNDGNGVRHNRVGGDFQVNGITVDLGELVQPNTRLGRLNHGRGVELGTVRITTYTDNDFGVDHDVDLSSAETVDDAKRIIEDAVDGVSVTLTGSKLIVNYTDPDAAEGTQNRLQIQDLSGHAARDLGIEGDAATGKISGRNIISMESLADVAAAINYASGNDGSVTASINGSRLEIDGGGAVSLVAMNNSKALADLGFEEGDIRGTATGRRLVAGLNSSLLHSLNGGRGFDLGTIQIESGGNTATVDLSGAESLNDIISAIQSAADANGLAIDIGYDRTGTRLLVTSDDGATPVTINDVTGTFAKQAGLNVAGAEIRGANLQKQYINETTTLDSLNAGSGVSLGKIKITNSLGLFTTVDLSDAKTLGDVIEKINAKTLSNGDAFGVTARINDTGDGLLLEDTTTGDQKFTVTDETGTAAADLNIAGETDTGRLDGSYEVNIEISAGETLSDLASRINEQTHLATATVMNDGNSVAPYRLQISSSRTGLAGELLIDDAALGLDFATLARPQDAKVVFGSDENSGLLLTSSTNTINDVAPGVSLTLTGTSDDPVTVTVSEDFDTILEQMNGLVTSYNAATSRIKELTKFDSDTEKAAILLGDSAVRRAQSRLARLTTTSITGTGTQFKRLSQVGIDLESGTLSFDEEKFREAFADDPEGVIEFFTDPDNGVAAWMEEQVNALTEDDGVLDSRSQVLERQKELLGDRVDRMNELLDRKRDRLTRQFNSMESALASLQAQQSALTQLSGLLGSSSTSSSG